MSRSVPFIITFLVGGLLIWLFFTPVSVYLNLYSLFKPQALLINNQPVSWNQLKERLKIVGYDKNLKTKQDKLKAAVNLAIEYKLLSQVTNKEDPSLSLYENMKNMREQINQSLINWRSGGYLIARFKVPTAIESAQVLKDKARTEILSFKEKLDQGQSFKTVLAEATNSSTLQYLNESAFLPGQYLEQITPSQFTLHIKSFRDLFFSLPEGNVSDVVTLSWDDYDGVSYGEKFSGEFAYAVIKVEQVNPGYFKDYNSWLDAQKQKAEIKSFVFVPFFFKLLSI